jgi:hypothetical protein
MSDTVTAAWLLGLAQLRASQIIRLLQLYEDGEIGRDGMIEAIRHEAQAILANEEVTP